MNTFAPFKTYPGALTIAGIGGFTSAPRFEGKCPNGLIDESGNPSRSPNLDLLAVSGDTVVAVESKFLEPLSTKTQALSPKYAAPFLGVDGNRPIAEAEWTEMYKRVVRMAAYPREVLPYRFLDAVQLVKHYLGLKFSYPHQRRVLVYLYWEPTNAYAIDAYNRHRDEVDDFTRRVEGCDTRFVAISYAELWREWDTTSPLARHAGAPGSPARPLQLRNLTGRPVPIHSNGIARRRRRCRWRGA